MSSKTTRIPVADRFWSKVDGGDVTTCWLWTAASTPAGYGSFSPRKGAWALSHRFAYETLRAEIPDGLHLDQWHEFLDIDPDLRGRDYTAGGTA